MPGPVNAALIAEWFDRHAAALEFYARQWTTAPEDCVQEAFVQLAQQNSPPADPRAWLFRAVRNRALNAVRADQRRAAREKTALQLDTSRPADDPADAAVLADLLQQLTDRQRELVVLRIWGQLNWREIATVVEGSRSAAQRDYVEALAVLKKHWEPLPCPKTDPPVTAKTRRCPTN
jgi:RNA polymerase sigma factor (sigma-70 family)